MAEIRHLAIWTDEPEKLAAFYVDTFGLQVLQPLVSAPGAGTWTILTDGHVRLALINPGIGASQPNGLHHFSFAAAEGEREAILGKLEARGIRPEACRNPYMEDRVCDSDGNVFDLAGTELRLRPGVHLTNADTREKD